MPEQLTDSNELDLKLSNAISDVAAFAIQYAKMQPSKTQMQFMDAIVSDDPAYSQIIAKTNRGGGKTQSTAISLAWKQTLDPTLNIFVLSGSFEQARHLYGYYSPLITDPEWFPQEELKHEPTQRLTKFKSGGSMRILAASEKQTRGGHPDIIVLDEAVLMPEELRDSIWPSINTSKRPKRIIISTASPKVGLNWFLDTWQNADKLNFKRYEWSREECIWLNQIDVTNAALLYGIDSDTYKTEYLGQIPERTGLIFDGPSIKRSLVDPTKEAQYPKQLAPPLTEWSAGVDWGFVHPHVIILLEKQGETLIARDIRIQRQGLLNDLLGEIEKDFGKYTIYAGNDGAAEINQLQTRGVNIYPVMFSRDKEALISELRRRLELGLLKIPDPDIDEDYHPVVQQLRSYHYEKSGKPTKVNDDCVDALLYAVYPWMADAARPRFKPHIGRYR